MENFIKLLKALWVVYAFIGIGWAALPFILAKSLELGWINWFGILTVPSGIAILVMILFQRKMTKDF